MTIANYALRIVSQGTRNIPYFRGLGRFYRFANPILLKAGATPIQTAPMKDGTTVIVDLRSIMEIDAFYTGLYDSQLMDALCTLLNPDGIFLDVGANVGFYTVRIGHWIRRKNGTGKVIAFEPFIHNFERLEKQIELNDLQTVCKAYNFGLSDRRSESLLSLREDIASGSSTGNASIFIDTPYERTFETVQVELHALDEVWKQLETGDRKLDLIKIDIEGHEDYFLRGGRTLFERFRPTILMEVNKASYRAREVEIDQVFVPLFPSRYRIFKPVRYGWQQITSLHECSTLDNVFLVPEERLKMDRYKIFSNRLK